MHEGNWLTARSVIILSNYAKQMNILQNFSRLNANNADTGLLRLTLKLGTIMLTYRPVIYISTRDHIHLQTRPSC